MLLLVIGALFLAVIGWWFNYKTSRFHRQLSRIPGPTPLPFFGNVLEIAGGFHSKPCLAAIKSFILLLIIYGISVTTEIIEVFETYPKIYGEIFRVSIVTDYYVLVLAPELAEVLKV